MDAPVNPRDSAGPLGKLLFTWMSPLVRRSLKGSFEQHDHFPISSDLQIAPRIETFQKFFHNSTSLFKMLWRMFSHKTLLFVLTLLCYSAEIGSVLLIYLITKMLSTTDLIDYIRLAAFLGSFLVLELAKSVMFVCFDRLVFVELLALRNCYIIQVLRKASRLALHSASKRGRGNLVNLVQVDAEAIPDCGDEFSIIFYQILNGVVGFALCFYFIRSPFAVFLGVNVIFALVSLVANRFELHLEEQLLGLKDARMSLLNNMFGNLRFIKFHVLEGVFLKLVFDRRQRELSNIARIAALHVADTFVNWLSPTVSLLVMLSYLLWRGDQVSIADFVAFYTLYEYINDFFRAVPGFLHTLFRLKLVNLRMGGFFRLNETDNSHMTLLAVNQNRFLDDSTVTDENKRKDRLDERKKNAVQIIDGQFSFTQVGLANIRSDSDSDGDSDSESESETKDSDIKKNKFSLKNLNLNFKTGELIFIIGDIGSGKTSLLHTILGELSPTDQKSKVVLTSESFAFCPQNPFIQAKSIRDNITFYEPLDEGRLRRALRLACLEDDLRALSDGVNTVLGEDGANLSGGQRTRINLARCFYRKREIYLFDDPLSSLDFNIATRVLEQGILRGLRGKTRLLVTHSIQFLLQADRVIFLRDGHVRFNGNVGEFRGTSWFRELEQTVDKTRVADRMSAYGSHVSVKTTEDFRFTVKDQSQQMREIGEVSEFSTFTPKRSINDINLNLRDFNERYTVGDSILKSTISKKSSLNRKTEYVNESTKKLKRLRSNDSQDSLTERLEVNWRRMNQHMSNSIKDIDSSDDSYSESLTEKADTERELKTPTKPSGSKQKLSFDLHSVPSIQLSGSPGLEPKDSQVSQLKTEIDMRGNDDTTVLTWMDSVNEKHLQKYFLSEDKDIGRHFWTNFQLFVIYSGGSISFVILLVTAVVNTSIEYFCMSKLYGLIEEVNQDPQAQVTDKLKLLYIYYLAPLGLVLVREIVIFWRAVAISRRVHHRMMFSTLFGDLLGFHERVKSARLINRFSNDIEHVDHEIGFEVSELLLHSGHLITDIAIGVLTIGWWVLILFAFYYILVVCYQHRYVRLKKDLRRLEALSKTPVLNLTQELLNGQLVFKAFGKSPNAMQELTHLLEENSKNLSAQNALASWFTIRVSLFNVLMVQLGCLAFIWCALRFDMISVKRVILFLPFCLSFVWNIDTWVNSLSQVETSLVALERCLAFDNIPSEPQYLGLFRLRKSLSIPVLSRGKLGDFIYKNTSKTRKKSRKRSKRALKEPLIDSREAPAFGPKNVKFKMGQIIFSQVNVRYPTRKKNALTNFTLQILPGEKIGIVGRTGSGKSTLIRLLSRHLRQQVEA